MTDDFLLPGRVQTRADILENTLFQSVSRIMGVASTAEFVIERSQWQDPVIQKAVDQLLPRFNINNKTITSRLLNLLTKLTESDRTESFEAPVYASSLTTAHFRKVEITVTTRRVGMKISGVPAVDGQDGAISRYYFNHQDYAGKLLDNNAIDFREINKFPITRQGDDLLFVSHETSGTPGLTFDGVEVPVAEVQPLTLKLNDGVERVDTYDSSGRPAGYTVRATKTGVIVFNKDALFPEIDVRDQIQIERLDYSVGNIGTEYSCPIVLKADTICNGFKVRVNGRVEVNVLDGGTIRTSSEAVVGMVQAQSRIMAAADVDVGSSVYSTIISEKGRVRIKHELIDSLIKAPWVSFSSGRGLFSNNILESQDLYLKGCYICGINTVRLGHSLFITREELLQERAGLEQQKIEFVDMERKLSTGLLDELKSIAGRVKDDNDSYVKFKLLIQLLQSRSFDSIHKVLDSLQKQVNIKVITQCRKVFEALDKTTAGIQSVGTRLEGIRTELLEIEGRLNSIQFSISGYLRPSASMVLYCGLTPRGTLPKPVLELDTDQEKDKRINVTGAFTLKDGFQFFLH
ncbi:MAG: flagellar assembly protein A [Pseudomonadota bacterium]